MPQDQSPRRLLERVIGLIREDIVHIENVVKLGKLEKDTSSDLARYSTALLSIVKETEGQDDKLKKSLNRLSDKDLLDMAEKALQQMKGEAPNASQE